MFRALAAEFEVVGAFWLEVEALPCNCDLDMVFKGTAFWPEAEPFCAELDEDVVALLCMFRVLAEFEVVGAFWFEVDAFPCI